MEKLVKIPQRFNQLLMTVLLVMWLVLSMPAHAQQLIEVGGELTENTTWTNEFTYIVIDDLIVPEGVELVIMPGVKVQFKTNRGLFVNQGSLKVLGAYEGETDTVIFMPHQGKLWKGIRLNKVQGKNNNIINFALIMGAETGISIVEGNEVVVSNTGIYDGNSGMELLNSSYNQIYNCRFISNRFSGVDIIGRGLGGISSDNIFEFNKFSNNESYNIRISAENGGVCPHNTIRTNVFDGAIYDIWVDNSYDFNNDKLSIIGNVFLNPGYADARYSISTGMDNAIIRENIFWENESAIELRRGNGLEVYRNNFYRNKNGLVVNGFVNNVSIKHNTFTENHAHVITFQGANDIEMKFNNTMNNDLSEGIIRNQTTLDIDVEDNFWGITDTLSIADLFWDFHNDDSLGVFNYIPFLDDADTIAPVSAPFQVGLQLVQNNTILTWHANPEEDIAGYAVYKGNMTDYQFADEPVVVYDTILVLPGDFTHEDFAVTAFDDAGYGWQQQREGNESPFAFGIVMPYAGADTTICNDVQLFAIRESTAPFAYDELFWTTHGDGVFDDPLLLRPVYIPGEMDKLIGAVNLTLNVVRNDVMHNDSFELTLRKSPEVSAGSDIIMPLADSLLLVEAEAMYYDHLEWMSRGDGFFSNPHQLHPLYYLGQQDIINGKIQFVLTASSVCGVVSDSMTVYLRSQYAIEGTILFQNYGVAGAAVLAFNDIADGRMQTAGLTQSMFDGWYRFDELFAADYLFYAVQDTSDNKQTLPTFYVNKMHWQDAYHLPLIANTYHVELELQQPVVDLPQGNGRISGRFELPDVLNGLHYYCLPWFEDTHPAYCDGGLSNISILLFNDTYEIPMGFSLTDANGRFYFEQLPFGRYYISAEIPGYDAALSSMITLSPEAADQQGIELRIEDNFKIEVFVPDRTVISMRQPYPNPADNYIHLLPGHDTEDPLIITLYSLQGQQVKQWEFQQIDSSLPLRLFVGGMAAGSYLLQLRTTERVKTYPVLIGQ